MNNPEKKLQDLSPQEIFDRVAAHLRRQKAPSMRYNYAENGELCAYRGDGGLKCAAGALISDDLYDPEMDAKGVGWSTLVRSYPELDTKYNALIMDLQDVHDGANPRKFLREVEKRLLEVAENHGLQYTAPIELMS